eukprot:1158955-Pelagomonas_calceolata.AAC.8
MLHPGAAERGREMGAKDVWCCNEMLHPGAAERGREMGAKEVWCCNEMLHPGAAERGREMGAERSGLQHLNTGCNIFWMCNF